LHKLDTGKSFKDFTLSLTAPAPKPLAATPKIPAPGTYGEPISVTDLFQVSYAPKIRQ
jgi:hypothetical protein